jgi:hypothetical protein
LHGRAPLSELLLLLLLGWLTLRVRLLLRVEGQLKLLVCIAAVWLRVVLLHGERRCAMRVGERRAHIRGGRHCRGLHHGLLSGRH